MDLHFVLSRPVIPENIGASARALNAMGFSHLRLVKPCSHLQDRAKWLACGSVEVLENARVYSTLAEAVADMDFIVGATARVRKQRHEYHIPSALRELLQAKRESVRNAAIVFGPESSGLSNEDLALCDVFTSIPTRKEQSALNLAQTVMIYAYELSPLLEEQQRTSADVEPRGSSHQVLKEKTGELLEQLEISRETHTYERIMERLSLLNDEDIRLSHFVRKKVEEMLGS